MNKTVYCLKETYLGLFWIFYLRRQRFVSLLKYWWIYGTKTNLLKDNTYVTFPQIIFKNGLVLKHTIFFFTIQLDFPHEIRIIEAFLRLFATGWSNRKEGGWGLMKEVLFRTWEVCFAFIVRKTGVFYYKFI